MSHNKTWACIKPDGDGCDGDHTVTLEDKFEKAAMELPWPVPFERLAIRAGIERGYHIAIEELTARAEEIQRHHPGKFRKIFGPAAGYLKSLLKEKS